MKFDYPETVFVAAKHLDLILPGWENKVNIKTLDMMSIKKCILTQVFPNNSFTETLDKYWENGDGNIFAGHKIEWITEINNRLNKVTEGNDFVWALAQMKDGKKVTLWNDLIYWYMKDGKIYNDGGVERNIFDIGHFPNTQQKGWRIVHQPKLSDLKVGAKFTVNSDVPIRPVYQKVVGGYIRIKRENQNCLEIWNDYKSFENARITIVS